MCLCFCVPVSGSYCQYVLTPAFQCLCILFTVCSNVVYFLMAVYPSVYEPYFLCVPISVCLSVCVSQCLCFLVSVLHRICESPSVGVSQCLCTLCVCTNIYVFQCLYIPESEYPSDYAPVSTFPVSKCLNEYISPCHCISKFLCVSSSMCLCLCTTMSMYTNFSISVNKCISVHVPPVSVCHSVSMLVL